MKKILHSIAGQFWAYLICIFVFVILWNGVFGFLVRIPEDEKVTVFIASQSETYAYGEELSSDRPQNLRAVDVRCAIPDSMYFDIYLAIYGYSQSDILILPETLIDFENLSDRFCGIDAEYAKQIGNLGTAESEGNVYGICVYDSESKKSLLSGIEWGSGDTDYYLFFRAGSLHTGDGDTVSENSTVAEILKQMLAY